QRLRARAERRRTYLQRRRGRIQQHLAGHRVLVVQPAAHRGRRIALGQRAVAGGQRIVAERRRGAAERRRTFALRPARRTRRGRVVALGERIRPRRRRLLARGEGLTFAGGAEVLAVRRGLFQLAQVHRIGVLGARGHVGDLA